MKNKLTSEFKKKLDVMVAFEQGQPIEYRPKGFDAVAFQDWELCSSPIWNWEHGDYRIAKPPSASLPRPVHQKTSSNFLSRILEAFQERHPDIMVEQDGSKWIRYDSLRITLKDNVVQFETGYKGEYWHEDEYQISKEMFLDGGSITFDGLRGLRKFELT